MKTKAPPRRSSRVRAGVRAGAMTVVRLDDGTSVSLPWPPPTLPEGRYGAWLPAVVGRHPDGTATGLWRWRDAPIGRPQKESA